MLKLLRAGFARLLKDRVFWIGMVFMFAAGVYGVVMKLLNDPGATADQLALIYPVFVGFVSAAFTSLYIGTEYSDGTLRNKLIVGHRRSAAYLANLVVCSAAGIALCLSYIAAVAAFGIPMLGLSEASMGMLGIFMLVSFAMVIACAALFTLLCMLNQNKAAAAVICILAVVALLIVASFINSMLDAPQYYDSYMLSDNTTAYSPEKVLNPQYLTGMKREVFQFFLDFLPTGQAIELSRQSTPNLWRMPLYSLLITLVSTVCGVVSFRRKDIK